MGQKYVIDGNTLSNIADAIRNKTGTYDDDYQVKNFASAINNLNTVESFITYTPGEESTHIDLYGTSFLEVVIYIEFSETDPADGSSQVTITLSGRGGDFVIQPSIQELDELSRSSGCHILYSDFGVAYWWGLDTDMYFVDTIDYIEITFEQATSTNNIYCEYRLVSAL